MEGGVILTNSKDINDFLKVMQNYSVTRAHLVPPIIHSLAKNPIVDKFNFPTQELHHIFPRNYEEYNLDFYDETVDICKTLLGN